jgi:hypothetical protein
MTVKQNSFIAYIYDILSKKYNTDFLETNFKSWRKNWNVSEFLPVPVPGKHHLYVFLVRHDT